MHLLASLIYYIDSIFIASIVCVAAEDAAADESLRVRLIKESKQHRINAAPVWLRRKLEDVRILNARCDKFFF